MGELSWGVRLHDLPEGTLEERIRLAGKLGFSCVHLASKAVYAACGGGRECLTPGLAAHLRETCDEAGVRVAVFGCYRNLAVPDDAALAEELAEYAACLRFAAWLGGCVVGTETGRPNVENRLTDERHGEAALERFSAGLSMACRIAEQAGVTLAIEPGWGETVHTPERCARVLEEVSSPALGVIWDPVAQLDPSLACDVEYQQSMVERMERLCGENVLVLHAKDFVAPEQRRPGPLVCTGPGVTGCYDYGAVVAWARDQKPWIQCVAEASTPDTVRGCLSYLQSR